MSTATRGRHLEHQIRHALDAAQFETIRSAGSKGAVDVVAFRPGLTLFIQAKTAAGPLPPSERAALLRWASRYVGVPLHVFRAAPGRIEWRELTGQNHDEWRPWSPEETA